MPIIILVITVMQLFNIPISIAENLHRATVPELPSPVKPPNFPSRPHLMCLSCRHRRTGYDRTADCSGTWRPSCHSDHSPVRKTSPTALCNCSDITSCRTNSPDRSPASYSHPRWAGNWPHIGRLLSTDRQDTGHCVTHLRCSENE